jgi:hypothetical protein
MRFFVFVFFEEWYKIFLLSQASTLAPHVLIKNNTQPDKRKIGWLRKKTDTE